MLILKIGSSEWKSLCQLTTFSEDELSKLNIAFCARIENETLSRRAFWELVAISHGFFNRTLPENVNLSDCLGTQDYLRIYLDENTLLASRMFSIFGICFRLTPDWLVGLFVGFYLLFLLIQT